MIRDTARAWLIMRELERVDTAFRSACSGQTSLAMTSNKEEILARRPERLLDMARFAGRVEEEGPRVRKGGNRFRATVTIVPLRSAAGTQVGYLMITRDLKEPPQSREQGVEPA